MWSQSHLGRNFEDLQKGLREIFRVLKPGGVISVLEFGQPEGFIFGPLYRIYSKYLMPLIGGILTGTERRMNTSRRQLRISHVEADFWSSLNFPDLKKQL